MFNEKCIDSLQTAKQGYRIQHGSCHGNKGEAPTLKIKMAAVGCFFEQNTHEKISEILAKNKNITKATQTWLNV